MDKLSRVQQKVFGETGNTSQFAEIGSQAAGTPTKTKNLATIQSLSQYLSGLYAITDNASQPPFIEELNSLFLLITSQLAYYFQNGFPEYDANTDYFNVVSFVQVNGVVYQSIDGIDGATNKGNAPASSPTKWRNVDPYTVKSYFDYAKTQLNTGTGVTGSDLYNVTKKVAIETKYEVGSIHPILYHKAPVVWNPTSKATVDAYNPSLDLSAITTVQVIDSTGVSSGLNLSPITKLVAPQWVAWARDKKMTIREGMTSPKSDFTLSSFSRTGGTVTLTFALDTDVVAVLAQLNEWALVEGASSDLTGYTADYTNTACLHIPVNLGAIPAGEYTLTGTNSSLRTCSFFFGGPDIGSTASSIQCAFMPYRIPGSATTAKITAVQGRALVGVNDAMNEYGATSKRRGRGQNHKHSITLVEQGVAGSVFDRAAGYGGGSTGATATQRASDFSGETTTGTEGAARVGPEYGIRDIAVHFHMGLGALES